MTLFAIEPTTRPTLPIDGNDPHVVLTVALVISRVDYGRWRKLPSRTQSLQLGHARRVLADLAAITRQAAQ